MRVLFISKEGDSLSLARRVDREGHKALFHITEPKARVMGEGLVEKVSVRQPLLTQRGRVNRDAVKRLLTLSQPNLVVFDMVGLGAVADYLSTSLPVFGGSKWADFTELNREYGTKLMHVAGIQTPPTTYFKTGEVEEAIEYVKACGKRLVYKPSGNIETTHTYVSKGADDLVAMLELWRRDGVDFELQEYVDGVTVSCELWWNGFTSHLHNWTMEEKALMDGGVGPATGCSGSVVCRCKKDDGLVREGVGKMEGLLKKVNYRGPIDLNCVCNEKGLYGLEFTVRMGYDAVQPLFELYKGSITKLLFDIAAGNKPEEDFYLNQSISIRLSIPPYPSPGRVEHVPILGVSPRNEEHVWLSDVRARRGGIECAGYDGSIGCVTARGKTVRECRRRAYRTIQNLTIPQVQYRLDIGERVSGDFAKLKEWGYL